MNAKCKPPERKSKLSEEDMEMMQCLIAIHRIRVMNERSVLLVGKLKRLLWHIRQAYRDRKVEKARIMLNRRVLIGLKDYIYNYMEV